MFGRDSIRELIAELREESKRRDEESKQRNAGMHAEFRRRDEEMREEFKRRDEEMREALRHRDEEMREFNREILLRNEKVYTSMIIQLEDNTEQTRANTKAVLSLLDRFNGSDGLAA